MNVNTKTVGLSLQENVISNEAASFGHWSVGDVVDDAAVTRVDQGLGLLLRLSDGILGFTHVSLLCDCYIVCLRTNLPTCLDITMKASLDCLYSYPESDYIFENKFVWNIRNWVNFLIAMRYSFEG